MNKENNEPWRDWEVKDWEQDIWKTRLYKFDFWNLTDEERAEEQSKGAYLQLAIEEGERGEFRKTWMEIIEERSAARKLMKEREREEDMEEDPDGREGKQRWQEKEEETREAYIKEIKEEEKEEEEKESQFVHPTLQLFDHPTLQLFDHPALQQTSTYRPRSLNWIICRLWPRVGERRGMSVQELRELNPQRLRTVDHRCATQVR